MPRQKITAIIGPSGCRKSTILRAFNRMTELVPSAWARGQVLYHGKNIYGPDVDLARWIYRGDIRTDRKRFQIENDCLGLIATQQPIARDLHILASMLEVNTELERMGDYAKGIACIAMELGNHPPIPYPQEISRMGVFATAMLHRSLSAYFNADENLERSIPREDDHVDALYNHVNNALIEMVGRGAASIDLAPYMMWAAHNLERMADRVTNICERTIFVATGTMGELDVSVDEIRGNGCGCDRVGGRGSVGVRK